MQSIGIDNTGYKCKHDSINGMRNDDDGNANGDGDGE